MPKMAWHYDWENRRARAAPARTEMLGRTTSFTGMGSRISLLFQSRERRQLTLRRSAESSIRRNDHAMQRKPASIIRSHAGASGALVCPEVTAPLFYAEA